MSFVNRLGSREVAGAAAVSRTGVALATGALSTGLVGFSFFGIGDQKSRSCHITMLSASNSKQSDPTMSSRWRFSWFICAYAAPKSKRRSGFGTIVFRMDMQVCVFILSRPAESIKPGAACREGSRASMP